MFKIALLVPKNEMLDQAHCIQNKFQLDFLCQQVISTEEAEQAAREVERAGADLIIARGLQATIIKKTTSLPIVDIKLAAQDLGFLLCAAKRQLAVVKPRIGLIVYSHMIGNINSFDELFDVQLVFFPLEKYEDDTSAVKSAAEKGIQLIIGGKKICDCAESHGIPTIYAASGVESMEDAFHNAEILASAIENEKKNTAETNAVLNSIFNGIIEVNKNAEIRRVNSFIEDMVGMAENVLVGRSVFSLISSLNSERLKSALEMGTPAYSIITQVNNTDMVTNIEPINMDGQISGAVITFQEGRRIYEIEGELRKELYRRGYIAKRRFKDIPNKSVNYQQFVDQAKNYSIYHVPILIEGENGTEKLVFAQCVHNESSRSKNSFIDVDCSAWYPDRLNELLFGSIKEGESYTTQSISEMAEEGTLFLDHIDCLSEELQYKICKLIDGQVFLNGEKRPLPARVRVLAGTEKNLPALVKQGKFRSDLYYSLSVLTLKIPPLREHKEDLVVWTEYYLNQFGKTHSRPVRMSRGAYACLEEFEWSGNLKQLETFCHRLVLLAPHRNIDESFVRRQLNQMETNESQRETSEKVIIFKDKNAAKIAEVLKKHGGDRTSAAQELGISKTTLWRQIKKFGIGPDFSY